MKKLTKRSGMELANAAFEEAAKDVVKRAVDTGTPLILWVNGEVKEVDPRTVSRSRASREEARKPIPDPVGSHQAWFSSSGPHYRLECLLL